MYPAHAEYVIGLKLVRKEESKKKRTTQKSISQKQRGIIPPPPPQPSVIHSGLGFPVPAQTHWSVPASRYASQPKRTDIEAVLGAGGVVGSDPQVWVRYNKSRGTLEKPATISLLVCSLSLSFLALFYFEFALRSVEQST